MSVEFDDLGDLNDCVCLYHKNVKSNITRQLALHNKHEVMDIITI
jgi:hypothetical protein